MNSHNSNPGEDQNTQARKLKDEIMGTNLPDTSPSHI